MIEHELKINRIYSTLEVKYANTERFKLAKSESDRFKLLITTLLSAQTTDDNAALASDQLFNGGDTPNYIVSLGLDRITKLVYSAGFYQRKALHVLETCKILNEEYNGKVPEDREALIELPGVGRKTLDVVWRFGFNHPAIAVDRHVYRVITRTGIIDNIGFGEASDKIVEITPSQYVMNAHQNLISHGRDTCYASSPNCVGCIINNYCDKLIED